MTFADPFRGGRGQGHAGLDPDYNADSFAEDLRPSWFFRQLPQGSYWYLVHQYLAGKFDGMLR